MKFGGVKINAPTSITVYNNASGVPTNGSLITITEFSIDGEYPQFGGAFEIDEDTNELRCVRSGAYLVLFRAEFQGSSYTTFVVTLRVTDDFFYPALRLTGDTINRSLQGSTMALITEGETLKATATVIAPSSASLAVFATFVSIA
jgi:hypothetical protein